MTTSAAVEAPRETRSALAARRARGIIAEKQLEQRSLAEALGMSQPTFSRRITGRRTFTLDEVEVLAVTLGVSEQYLLGFTNDRTPRPAGPDGAIGGDVHHLGLEPRTRWLTASGTPRRHLSIVGGGPALPREPLAPVVPLPVRRAA